MMEKACSLMEQLVSTDKLTQYSPLIIFIQTKKCPQVHATLRSSI